MKKWLFNPFVYIAGARALVVGCIVMLLTAVIGFYSHTHFDGVIDLHFGKVSPLSYHLLEQLIDWACIVIVFFIAGKIFSRSSIRFVDVAGTLAFARWVLVFPTLIGFAINAPATLPHDTNEILKLVTPAMICYGLVSLVFIIWMIALMYNAFTISCNLKGGKATGVFIAALLAAEILSKIAIHFLYHDIPGIYEKNIIGAHLAN